MRGKSRNKSAVIFIDEESLVPAAGWAESDSKKQWGRAKSPTTRLHTSFRNYLFSENSILIRLFSSLVPPFGRFQRIPVDHQGTFLSIFILFAIIYLGYMKTRAISRLQALLASGLLSLGYVLGISIMILLMSYLTKTKITFRQTVSVVGYGLFGHALALLVCEFWSDRLFIPSLIFFGGLATARICFVLFARAPIAAFRFVVCTPVGVIHLLYLVYLHFAIMREK